MGGISKLNYGNFKKKVDFRALETYLILKIVNPYLQIHVKF